MGPAVGAAVGAPLEASSGALSGAPVGGPLEAPLGAPDRSNVGGLFGAVVGEESVEERQEGDIREKETAAAVAAAVVDLQERVAGETWKLIGGMKYGYTAKALKVNPKP